MATAGKGLPFIGKMNEFLDKILHPTVNKTGHSSAALDVTGRSFFAVNDINTPLVVEGGSTDNILIHTGLNAIAGDVIRIMSSANGIKEFEIVVHEAPDADTAILAGFLTANLTAGDTFHHLRPVRELSLPDGSSMATVISPPIQIIKNGAVETVTDDTNPANVVAIPVVIKATDGTNITINAGDISVQNSAEGVNFDSIRIGDGTNKYAAITANLEIEVHDQGVIDALGGLATSGLATESKQDDIISGLVDIETELQTLNTTDFATETTLDALKTRAELLATEAKQDTQITRLNLLATEAKQDTQITRLNLLATEAKQDTQITRLNLLATEASLLNSITQETAINTVLGTQADAAASSDTATFSLMAFIKRGMQNWTALLAKIPAIGQATKAASIPVVLASDSDALRVNEFNSAGQIAKATLSASASTTAIAPAGATGCFIKNQSQSVGDYLFWEIGGTATTASNDLVPGQGTAFIPCVGTISLLADSTGSANYVVQWLIK